MPSKFEIYADKYLRLVLKKENAYQQEYYRTSSQACMKTEMMRF